MRCLAAVLLVACGTPTEPGTDPGSDATPGTDGPGSVPDDRLLPLAIDRAWTYDVVSTYPSCPGGQREQRVIGTSTIDARPTFRVRGFCGVEGESSVDGDRVEDHYDWGPIGWTRILDEPVEAGHAWTTTNGSATFGMHYEEAGSVGGHVDCWKVVQEVSYTSHWTYCRGVGLVRFEMIDLGGGTIRADLRSTTF
jgi:hypothetical protein